jgi:hypothetical protein
MLPPIEPIILKQRKPRGRWIMAEFSAKRVVKKYEHQVAAQANIVFPLLCPVREYEWINGWNCEMVYSESGVAENNCTFKTDFPDRGEGTWVVTDYDSQSYRIAFAIFHADRFLEKIDIALSESDAGTTTVRWTRTFTGLSSEGNEFIEQYAGDHLDERMEWLGESLDHFCKTGEMLKHQ